VPRTSERRSTHRRVDRIVIECVTPELDGGRYPVKRIVGDVVEVGADIFREGHDLLSAQVVYRGPDETAWSRAPMRYDYDADRWFASFTVDRIGRWLFDVEAWSDAFGDWRAKLEKRVAAEQDVSTDLLTGAQLVRTAARALRSGAARASLIQTARVLEDRRQLSIEQRVRRALDADLLALMTGNDRQSDLTRYHHQLAITVDRERARFAAWYEMFPRSQRADATHATLDDAADALPRIAELGFDVVYLPPIHPVGRSFRKGKNNTLEAAPDDVGSPWAIGNEHGGHEAIEPGLGTIDDFDRFVARAHQLGMEIALDYALQCSPDHPWVKEHPDWFHVRPDGTIAYAENPPKKYQDIYPLNFWCADRDGLWAACRDVLLHWIEHGVKIFRVDNPHTKPMAFWEWVIREVQGIHPDVIFFSEAFTRPKKMKHLAKLGFTMSYTHFTWKNSAWEIREYLTELTTPPTSEYFRGNLFANTPDILHEYLVRGGRPAFRIRLLLAATLLPSYGIYSGFELGENVPLRPGSEEYLDSEKYQLRPRDWDAPGHINDDVALINRIRREQPALRQYTNLTFLPGENERILFYMKEAGAESLLIAVTTNPQHAEETMVHVPLEKLGIAANEPFVVEDLLTGAKYTWRGVRNYVRLDPAGPVGHVLRIVKASPLPRAGD
jgi:starch synthase (maltosyl-transferring)